VTNQLSMCPPGACHLHLTSAGMVIEELIHDHLQRCGMKLGTKLASCLPFVIYAWKVSLSSQKEQIHQVDIWVMREHRVERLWLKVRQLGPQPSFCHSKGILPMVVVVVYPLHSYIHTYATFPLKT
jgi:hypothetical protein